MSKHGLMVDRCIDPNAVPVLLDLGYVKDAATRARGDAIMAAGIGRRNFSIEGFGRLLVKIPKRHMAKLADFPILEGKTYFQTTHHWRGLSEDDKHD